MFVGARVTGYLNQIYVYEVCIEFIRWQKVLH